MLAALAFERNLVIAFAADLPTARRRPCGAEGSFLAAFGAGFAHHAIDQPPYGYDLKEKVNLPRRVVTKKCDTVRANTALSCGVDCGGKLRYTPLPEQRPNRWIPESKAS
jgi:hypothetical protein